MKRSLIIVVVALVVLAGAYGLTMADTDPPHSDYRPGYQGASCGTNPGTGACHDVTANTFLPNSFNHNDGTSDDYTIFCLSCHNSAGEAHNRNVGVASTNKYVNFTGIDPNFPYTGNAHSWNGVIGNAGTRFPTLSGFMYDENGGYHPNSPTLHMVDWSTSSGKFYKVRCQTCHVAMYKTFWLNSGKWSGDVDWAQTNPYPDNTRYKLLISYSTTKTYLNPFVQVYEESAYTPRPQNSRTKEQYLVNPSLYTYNDRSALVIFKQPQPAGTNVTVDIRQPYLRFDNSYDTMCVDCHYNRPSQQATHAPGTGVLNGHPVSGVLQGITVPFGYKYGLHSTLMPHTKGNVLLQDGKIYCTTCHQQHNAPSNDGELHREATGTDLCSDCHKTKMNGYSGINSVNFHDGPKHTTPTECLDCHTAHNTNNIMLIRNVINGKRVVFENFTGSKSFGPDTGFGVCEVCHTTTAHHLSDNAPSGQGHHTDQNCTLCHKHNTGFQPTGACTSCHGQPPAPGNAGPQMASQGGYDWADKTGGMHSFHMGEFLTKFPGISGVNPATGADYRCGLCHGNMPNGTHPQNLTTAYINTTSAYWQGSKGTVTGTTNWGTAVFSIGSTAGYISTNDDTCTNVGCHNASGTRSWSGGSSGNGPYGLACDSCHEYPGSTTNDWPSTNGHSVRSTFNQVSTTQLLASGAITAGAIKHLSVASAYNATLDYYSSVTKDPNKCGKCHYRATHGYNGSVAFKQYSLVKPYTGPDASVQETGATGFTLVNHTFGSSAQCSNVRCHFNRTTPNWY